MNDVRQNGYILLPGVLTNSELEFGLTCMHDNKVDYTIMKQFIDNIFFQKVKEKSGVITEPKYVKFRLSNNNNSIVLPGTKRPRKGWNGPTKDLNLLGGRRGSKRQTRRK